jgi:hypothetical protein
MNRFATCGNPRDRGRPNDDDERRNDRVVQIGPDGLAAPAHVMGCHKIAGLTGATEGGAYQMLLVALIEEEKRLDPREFSDCA